MYPSLRLAKELWKYRKAAPLAPGEAHATRLICWPWDIDVWLELNNGRTLTLGDVARIVMFKRMGAMPVMRANRWGGTVAGSVVRYRRRVALFARIEVRARVIGWDERFTYVDQTIWLGDTCASQAVLRTAVTDRTGIVAPARVAEAMGYGDSPVLPEWVRAWSAAEALRPWPPER